MKKILFALILVGTIFMQKIQAQAWSRDTKVLSLAVGGAYYYHFGSYTLSPYRTYYYTWSPTAEFLFQGEFGVHDYVGIGFSTGVGGGPGWTYRSSGEVNVPIGFTVNFHFYQLIADKVSRDIYADKIDLYGGINVGSGIAAVFFSDQTRITPIIFGGPHVGIRYYFNDRVGVNGEIGFGKTFVNGGVVFKL